MKIDKKHILITLSFLLLCFVSFFEKLEAQDESFFNPTLETIVPAETATPEILPAEPGGTPSSEMPAPESGATDSETLDTETIEPEDTASSEISEGEVSELEVAPESESNIAPPTGALVVTAPPVCASTPGCVPACTPSSGQSYACFNFGGTCTCATCGKGSLGQPCCPGSLPCDPPYVCNASNFCAPAPTPPSCTALGSTCTNSTECCGYSSVICGSTSSKCCKGTGVASTNSSECCSGYSNGTTCQLCGVSGAPCCSGSSPCNSGLVCNSGICQVSGGPPPGCIPSSSTHIPGTDCNDYFPFYPFGKTPNVGKCCDSSSIADCLGGDGTCCRKPGAPCTANECCSVLSCLGPVGGKTCTVPLICGNGIKEGTEFCDGTVGCTAPNVCNSSCSACGPPGGTCGNGIKEGAEICDGAAGCTAPSTCNSSCTACTTSPPMCGNGVKESTEICDGSASPSGCTAPSTCNSSCTACTTSCIVLGNSCTPDIGNTTNGGCCDGSTCSVSTSKCVACSLSQNGRICSNPGSTKTCKKPLTTWVCQ